MRRNKNSTKPTRILLTILIFIFAIGLISCAEKKVAPARKRPKPPPPVQTRVEEKQPEAAKPAKPRIGGSEAATPARNASNSLVEKGKTFISGDQPELAAGKFKDAIQVDASNGQAYYFLALSYSKMNEPDLARGTLDKASNLLRHDPEWSQKIDELRNGLAEGY